MSDCETCERSDDCPIRSIVERQQIIKKVESGEPWDEVALEIGQHEETLENVAALLIMRIYPKERGGIGFAWAWNSKGEIMMESVTPVSVEDGDDVKSVVFEEPYVAPDIPLYQ